MATVFVGCGRSVPHVRVAPLPPRPPVRTTETVARPSRCSAPPTGRLDYAWPVQPFHVQHPIRGNFGDPRTISYERFGVDGLGELGAYSFHNGVDVSARPGTPVYPVVSGVAHVPDRTEVRVRATGRAFQYWHITPAVHDGEHVVAGRTVLGWVQSPARHVHLTEIDHGRVWNPADHLQPYRDSTVPAVRSVSFLGPSGRPLDPEALAGGVSIVAQADDTPPVPVPGAWGGFPVTPALVRWQLRRDGRRVAGGTTADVRRTEPPSQRFWSVYAAGTYQNFPVFDHRYYWRRPGRFLFLLTPTPLDTGSLPDGSYTLRVLAQDVCGNRGTWTELVRVADDSGQ